MSIASIDALIASVDTFLPCRSMHGLIFTTLTFRFGFDSQMASRAKRGRTGHSEASSSRAQEDAASPPPPTRAAPLVWPRREKQKIRVTRDWDDIPAKICTSQECRNREISEEWDDYDTLFYNAWCDVQIKPTRFADEKVLDKMGLKTDFFRLLKAAGLGTMPTRFYKLYPELVRQFMATVRVYYENERVRRAAEGTLTFMINGVRYRISIRDICRLYRFQHPDYSRTSLPGQFPNQKLFWELFATGEFSSRDSVQSDIRHPILRYFAKTVSHTILCKMEPNKMRVSELILMYYGLRRVALTVLPDPEIDYEVNMGCVFADHLEKLKMKPFTGTRAKTETVGSLLTPIFEFCRVNTGVVRVVSAVSLIDETYLTNARWLQSPLRWCYRDDQGDHVIQLPHMALTTITNDVAQLEFLPGDQFVDPPPPRRSTTTRGSSARAATSAGADDSVDPGSAYCASLPQFPAVPDAPTTEEFQQFMVGAMSCLWAHHRCPPRTHFPTPVVEDDGIDDAADDDAMEDDAGSADDMDDEDGSE